MRLRETETVAVGDCWVQGGEGEGPLLSGAGIQIRGVGF